MSDIAISVENISKRYRIGVSGGPSYHRLSEMISGVPRALWNYGRTAFRPSKDDPGEAESANKDEFWALKDVSFEVKRGEVVGIIGRNGAGKSTLLKILSRITEPTTGRFGIRGRVASLLEVGTGFHPELTGRENIYVSGITLGMTRSEIKKNFDEIVDFSGVEEFLDTPVKNYSSGMQVRLGFAVAAHLESEILIVDEVLAVGDAEFQSQCLRTMSNVSESGKTILFVSHNMSAIQRLCTKGIFLSGGYVAAAGICGDVVSEYLSRTIRSTTGASSIPSLTAMLNDPAIQIEDLAATQLGELRSRFTNGDPIEVRVTYRILSDIDGLRIYFDLTDESETLIIRTFHDDNDNQPATFVPGRYVSTLVIPDHFLAPREYCLVMRVGIFNERSCFGGQSVSVRLAVEQTSSINRAYPGDPVRSLLLPKFCWTTQPLESSTC